LTPIVIIFDGKVASVTYFLQTGQMKYFYEIQDGRDRNLENGQSTLTIEPFKRLSPSLTG
jgi:hypothetical protein